MPHKPAGSVRRSSSSYSLTKSICPSLNVRLGTKSFFPASRYVQRTTQTRKRRPRTLVCQNVRYQRRCLHFCSGHAQVAANRLGTLERRKRDDLGHDRLCCIIIRSSSASSDTQAHSDPIITLRLHVRLRQISKRPCHRPPKCFFSGLQRGDRHRWGCYESQTVGCSRTKI